MSELLNQLIHFHLTVRRKTATVKTCLSLAAGQVLGVASSLEKAEIALIAERMLLERSSVSRMVKRLVESGYLKESHDPGDARKKIFTVTSKGSRDLRKDDLARSSVTEWLVQHLDQDEQERLLVGFRRLADSLEVAPASRRADEHPLRAEQRRLTRAFGLLSDRFFGSEVSITGLQILFYLRGEGYTPLATVSDRIPYDQSTLSRSVKKLVGLKLINQRWSKEDRRRCDLTITEQGLKFLKTLSHKISKHASRSMGADLSADLHDVLAQINLRSTRSRLEAEFGQEVKQLSEKGSFKEARTFLIERCVAEERHSELPAEIYPRGDNAYALYETGTVVACCEARRMDLDEANRESHTRWEIVNGARSATRVSARSYFTLIERCCSELQASDQQVAIELEPSAIGLTQEQCKVLRSYLPKNSHSSTTEQS